MRELLRLEAKLAGPILREQSGRRAGAMCRRRVGGFPAVMVGVVALAIGSLAQRAVAGVNEWTTSGPELTGAISAIVVHPTDPNTVWVATSGGGVFRTTDGGASWQSLHSGLPSIDVFSLVMDPSNPAVLYAGLYSGKVVRSVTGGELWVELPVQVPPWMFFLPNRGVRSIAIDPADPLRVLVAGENEV